MTALAHAGHEGRGHDRRRQRVILDADLAAIYGVPADR